MKLSSLHRNLLAFLYAVANCILPAPIMLINILALFSKELYAKKNLILANVVCIVLLLLFVPFHLSQGVQLRSYWISFFLLIFIFATSIAAGYIFSHIEFRDSLIKQVAKNIFLLFLFTTFILVASGGQWAFGWYEHSYTRNVTILRYGGFMYEASHLCLVISPALIYFLAKPHLKVKDRICVSGLIIPALASYSVGFFTTLLAAFGLSSLSALKKKATYQSAAVVVVGGLLICIFAYSVSDAVQQRLDNIISFTDSSARGRIYDSYYLAFSIAKEKSLLLGVGPGQIKIIGEDIITGFYGYSLDVGEVVRIPSSIGELLASYGIIGVLIKLCLLVWLYIITGVKNNRFSHMLFMFFFVYQFYGNFMVSSIEIFAFSTSFFVAAKEGQGSAKYRVSEV